MMLKLIALFSIAMLTAFYVQAVSPATVYVVPESESTLSIRGNATPFNYHCQTETIVASFMSSVMNVNDRLPSSDIQIIVPVSQFNCGVRRLNKDFKDALNVDIYDEIRFDIIHINKRNNNSNCNIYLVAGDLFVSGTTRRIILDVIAKRTDNNKVLISGKTKLSMDDFNIAPPSSLMGLVRVEDEMIIEFSILYDENHIFQ